MYISDISKNRGWRAAKAAEEQKIAEAAKAAEEQRLAELAKAEEARKLAEPEKAAEEQAENAALPTEAVSAEEIEKTPQDDAEGSAWTAALSRIRSEMERASEDPQNADLKNEQPDTVLPDAASAEAGQDAAEASDAAEAATEEQPEAVFAETVPQDAASEAEQPEAVFAEASQPEMAAADRNDDRPRINYSSSGSYVVMQTQHDRPGTYYEGRSDSTNEYYFTEVQAPDKKVPMRIARNYLIVAVLCAVIGAVYEIFSHGVFSVFMAFAFVIPLVLGALPNLVIGLSGQKTPGVAAENLYACGIATLTIGSLLKGVLDIYGTTNSMLKYYWIVGAAFAVIGAISYFAQKRKKKAAAA